MTRAASTAPDASRPRPSREGLTDMRPAECLRTAALCAVGALLVFWLPLLGGRCTLSFDPVHPLYPAPWAAPVEGERPLINPITSDVDFFVLPGLMRMRQLERERGDPFWDGGQLLGYSPGANIPFPIFSPLARALSGLDPITTLDVMLWLHTALAALLAARAARLLGADRGGAALAAVGFALSTWMITRWHLPQIAYTTTWFPGLVAVVERLRQGRRVGALMEAALWVALLLVSGFPQVGLVCIAGFVVLLLMDKLLRRPGPLLVAAGGILLGLALAAPQLNALASVYPDAARTTPQTRAAMARQGLAPGALLGAVLPEAFGRPSDFARADPPAPSMKAYLPQRLLLSDDMQDNVVENALYPGVVVLVLLGALMRRGTDRRARHLGLLALLAVVGALAFPHLVERVPSLALFGTGHVNRVLVLVAGSLPLAAALVLRPLAQRRVPLPVGTALALAAALLLPLAWSFSLDAPDAPAWRADLLPQVLRQGVLLASAWAALVLLVRGVRGAAVLLVVVLAVDLGGLAWTFNPFPVQAPRYAATESLAWLAARPGRVAVLGDELLLPPPLAALHGIRSPHGVAPLVKARTLELLACIEGPLADPGDPRVVRGLRRETSLDHPLLDLLEVRTVVHADPGLAARRDVANAYENPREALAALDRPGAGPRAFLCGGAQVVEQASLRLAHLADRDFEVHASVLLEQAAPFALPERGAMLPVPVEERAGVLHLRLTAPFDGVLVLTEAWDRGWQVRLDGERVTPLIADHALLGVPVRAGEHQLEFAYVLPGRSGARLVSGAAALVLLALGAWRLLRSGRVPGSP